MPDKIHTGTDKKKQRPSGGKRRTRRQTPGFVERRVRAAPPPRTSIRLILGLMRAPGRTGRAVAGVFASILRGSKALLGRRRARKLQQAPGSWWIWLAHNLMTKRARASVVEVVADMREEVFAASSSGEVARARWLRVVYGVAIVNRLIGGFVLAVVRGVVKVAGAGD